MAVQSHSRDWLEIALAVGAVAIFVGFLALAAGELGRSGDNLPNAAPPVAAGAASHSLDELVPAEAVHIAPSARSMTIAYECIKGDVREYSDKPCDGEVAEVVLGTDGLSTYSPVPVGTNGVNRQQVPASAGASPVISDGASTASQKARPCELIQREIDDINARMRQPYTRAEGDRLRALWHRAKERYYDEGCGRTGSSSP